MPELRYAHVGSTTYNLRDDRLDTVEDSGAEFTSRTATHDNAGTVETLRGNTLVWNQLVNTMATTTTDGITTSYDSSTHLFSITNNNRTSNYTSGSTRGSLFTSGSIAGHKYAVVGDYVEGVCIIEGGNPVLSAEVGQIYTNSSGSTISLRVTNHYDFVNTHPVGNVCTFHMCIYDLTLMFGAGNEPATVADFEALYPEAYYAYDAGSLLPVNVTGMTSTGTGWTQTRAIDATYMPLRKAGSVYDELTPTKLTRRVGVVDLGSLTWEIYDAGLHIFRAMIAAYTGHNGSNNMICEPPYTCVSASTPAASLNDKEMKQTAGPLYTYPLYARDTTCNTATDITTAMNGVYLFYELATPTETTISPALNLSYRVENGGTETWEPPSGEMTAPVDADIAYGWLPVLAGYVQS